LTDIVSYLAAKGVQTFRAAGNEVTAHCVFCPDGDPKRRGRLYINTVDGVYQCKRCEEAGNLKTLMKHFGDEPVTDLPGQDPAAAQRALRDADAICRQMLQNNDDVLSWLLSSGAVDGHPEWGLGRGLDAQTILDRGYGYAAPGWSIKDHLLDHGHKLADIRAAGLLTHREDDFLAGKVTIPYVVRGSVVQLRGKELGGKYFTGPGQNVRLYGVDDLADADEAIITEGEFDRDALKQILAVSPDARLRNTAVVGIPGAGSLADGFPNYFNHLKRIYIALDPDATGQKGAIKIKEKLGSKSRIVELPLTPEGAKQDWTDLIARKGWTWREVKRSLGDASGKRVFTFGDGEEELARVENSPAGQGIKLGFSAWDAAIDPGIRPGQVAIILARPGAGKTQWLCNVMYNLRRRIPQLFISLEMTKAEVVMRLKRIYHFWNPTATVRDMEDAFSLLRIVDNNRLTVEEFHQVIDEFTEDVGEPPRMVLVDYLGYFARGVAGSNPYEKTSNAAMALKAIAKGDRGSGLRGPTVAMIVLSQVNRGVKDGQPIDLDDARDSGVVEETGDFLASLYRPEDAVEVAEQRSHMTSGRVHMTILKSRHGGKGIRIQLRASAASLVMVDEGTKHATRVGQENAAIDSGKTYAQIREIQAPRQGQLAVVA
jgi:hypothetical protein